MAEKTFKITPKFLQLNQHIKSQIIAGKYKVGEKIPSERYLSEKYSLNCTTVNKAISSLVTEGLLEREHGRGTFVRDVSSLDKKSMSPIIGFIFFQLDFYMSKVVEGMESILQENGFRLVIRNSEGNLDKEKQAIEELIKSGVNGLIIYPVVKGGKGNVNTLRQLKTQNPPFVLVDRYFKELDTDYVGVDNTNGLYIITKHLIAKGHCRIAHLMTPSQCTTVNNRLKGYKKALADSGIEFDESLVKRVSFSEDIRDNHYEEIGGILNEWNNLQQSPTAITTTADGLAVIVLKNFVSMGVRVPHDIAITGFDDIDVATLVEVPLTTLRAPIREVGIKAGEIIVKRIRGKILEKSQRVILPVELVVRASTKVRQKTSEGRQRAEQTAILREDFAPAVD